MLSLGKQHDIDVGKLIDKTFRGGSVAKRAVAPGVPGEQTWSSQLLGPAVIGKQIDLQESRNTGRAALVANKVTQTKPWTWFIREAPAKVVQRVAGRQTTRDAWYRQSHTRRYSAWKARTELEAGQARQNAIADAIDVLYGVLASGPRNPTPITRAIARLQSEAACWVEHSPLAFGGMK